MEGREESKGGQRAKKKLHSPLPAGVFVAWKTPLVETFLGFEIPRRHSQGEKGMATHKEGTKPGFGIYAEETCILSQACPKAVFMHCDLPSYTIFLRTRPSFQELAAHRWKLGKPKLEDPSSPCRSTLLQKCACTPLTSPAHFSSPPVPPTQPTRIIITGRLPPGITYVPEAR